MKTCPRCRSVMLQEPFTDGVGSGDSWVCLACGERIETYLQLHSGAFTAAQLRELRRRRKIGRRPSEQTSREAAK